MFAFIGQTNPIDYASISRHKCHVSKYWQNSLYLLLCVFMSFCDICKNYANCLIRHLNVQWTLISPVCLPIMHSTGLRFGLRLGGSWECALNKHNALYMQICLTPIVFLFFRKLSNVICFSGFVCSAWNTNRKNREWVMDYRDVTRGYIRLYKDAILQRTLRSKENLFVSFLGCFVN